MITQITQMISNSIFNLRGNCGDFPGCPVVKTVLPLQGVPVRSLVEKLNKHVQLIITVTSCHIYIMEILIR